MISVVFRSCTAAAANPAGPYGNSTAGRRSRRSIFHFEAFSGPNRPNSPQPTYPVAANDLAVEHKTGTLFGRFENQLDTGELSGTAGLLLVRVVHFGKLGDGLAISDLRLADIGLHLELTLHTINKDIEMQFAHAFDHGLAGLVIDAYPERRIFLC